jgi:hypothetical protein
MEHRRERQRPTNRRKVDKSAGSNLQYGGDDTTAKQRARKRNRLRAQRKSELPKGLWDPPGRLRKTRRALKQIGIQGIDLQCPHNTGWELRNGVSCCRRCGMSVVEMTTHLEKLEWSRLHTNWWNHRMAGGTANFHAALDLQWKWDHPDAPERSSIHRGVG